MKQNNKEANMQPLEALIPIGKGNAIHLEKLAKMVNLTPAATKKLIRDARLNGVSILSGSCGYWKPENREEREEYAAMMQKQAISRLKTTTHERRILNIPEGQESIYIDPKEGKGE